MFLHPKVREGYTVPIVSNAADNSGSPWNPLWAHDETLGPNIIPVALKTAGIAGVFAGAVYSAGSRSIKGFGGKMIVGGTAAYLLPNTRLRSSCFILVTQWETEQIGKSGELHYLQARHSADMSFTGFQRCDSMAKKHATRTLGNW